MKTILVPTDFSKVAENAINYAAEIGKLTKAKIVLFHAFHVPVVATEGMYAMPALVELERNCMSGLKKIQRKLHLHHGEKLSVECVCQCGFAVDEITSYTSANRTDLIVMGMQGAGYLSEKLIGSITTALIQKSKCPVLAIDKEVKFRSVKKIALACDYNAIENAKIFEPLKEFAKLFKSHIYVLNVIGEHELEPVRATESVVSDFMKFEYSLADVNHTFHYLENEEVVDGINKFVMEGKMDMVVMIPHKHTVLKNIFNEPNTKRMAFHSKVPLLTLH